MLWALVVCAIMLLIGCRALALAIHFLSGQHEIDERLRLYAGR
jgi:hypothetical protein